MSPRVSSAHGRADTGATRGLRLTRGVAATWWYTLSAVVFFEVMVVFIWAGALFEAGRGPATLFVVGVGGLVWTASTVPLLLDYRHRIDESTWARWPRLLVPLLVAAVFGGAAGVASGLWLIAILPLAQSVLLLNWPAGVRVRMLVAATMLLGAAWFVDARLTFAADPPGNWWLVGFFSTFMPAMTVVSLWWWDVLIAIDRARASEARLAATQERLRVATDVHDLQGHHLQVIALQLELAERLMSREPEAALEQLRAARASVDEARQGTRDLATRFRSVPLRDEIENAADLLRAAGTAVQTIVSPDADEAPDRVLAPIIRETTTNVLRHGGGVWAHLELARDKAGWRYRIANDTGGSEASRDGAGLEGIGRRVSDAGGTFEVRRDHGEFSVVVVVPSVTEGAA
ncbi:sensor histidine kinase [Microbacterium sp. CPCC 204701]|uniref:sensor histidine kinase n=1 Tax=Microbacterium sp. CPCC 204701 TaxID=2493084 RepID=UPI000FD8DFC2|nr:histidine kinase [Microbacterium sp. CPCC 204701]